jgi:choline dehydrogenase-like flavoprotein
MTDTYDYIIVGSGFGGSVSAMRLAEKGYSTLILEQGKRFEPGDFAKSNWNLRKYLWLPQLGMYGIQKLLFNRPTTAHILGGVPMGKSAKNGVVNEKLEVFNYPGLYIIDGSIIQTNPGVNPSYSILAMAEYAMSLIPENKGNKNKSLNQQLNEI